MPNKPKHPCNKPGCSLLTNERFCPDHAKQHIRQYELSRETATERGYNAHWKKIRDNKVNHDPLCERCLKIGIDRATQLVHHKDRNRDNWSNDNLESLCIKCHDKEHQHDKWKK